MGHYDWKVFWVCFTAVFSQQFCQYKCAQIWRIGSWYLTPSEPQRVIWRWNTRNQNTMLKKIKKSSSLFWTQTQWTAHTVKSPSVISSIILFPNTCKRADGSSRLEVSNNKQATARGSWFYFFSSFWWYMREAVVIPSRFLSCCLSPCLLVTSR